MFPGRQIGVAAAPAKRRWSVLIAAQVALTLLLMATAGTAIRSFLELMQMPLGYDPTNVMKLGMLLHLHEPGEWCRIRSRRSARRLHRTDSGENRIRARCLHCRCLL